MVNVFLKHSTASPVSMMQAKLVREREYIIWCYLVGICIRLNINWYMWLCCGALMGILIKTIYDFFWCQLVSKMLRNIGAMSSAQLSLLEHSVLHWRESNSRSREKRKGKKVITKWRYLLLLECLAFNWGSFCRLSILKQFLFHVLSQHLYSQAICFKPFALKFWQTPAVITHYKC